MPWRYYRRNWRRRPWWRYQRRPRKAFRRRWRRKRYSYWVRNSFKKKLKTITVKQFQPPNVRKCKIKGLMNLIYFNQKRLIFNSVMYENSLVPEEHPGGGGFSVIKLSLETMYDSHLRCHNWWTTSNEDLPLVRYSGMTVKLYQSKYTDYVFKYQNYLPGTSTYLTYPACQPSMMMMAKNSVIVPSLETKRRRKPYKKIHIKPTSQLQTKWYFQTDLNKTPLAIFYTAACSLTSYYLSPDWESNNISILHLNTLLFQHTNFKNYPHKGYAVKTVGTESFYLYVTDEEYSHTKQEYEYQLLTPLTNTKDWTIGQNSAHNHQGYQHYKTDWRRYAGNPFLANTYKENVIFIIKKDPDALFQNWNSQTAKFNLTTVGGAVLDQPIYQTTRYNPNRDEGIQNEMYLVNVTKDGSWDTPTDFKTKLTGFPLWIQTYGYTDYQKKQNIIGVEEQHVVIFKTTSTKPGYWGTFLPISQDFISGNSPYLKSVHGADKDKWYPQVQYQADILNKIAKCGPGTPKSSNYKSDDIKIEYTAYFKWGGAPAKMVKIDDPSKQEYYPVPSNELQTTSLQNPAYPPEYYLYSFDERQGQLTQRAAKRIKHDWETKKTLFSPTESPKEVPAQTTSPTTSEESDSEKEEETLFQQLINQQQKQRKLRHRIKQLMKQIKDS
nr:MAG: ORF1 [TTV-like mini virus]UGV34276.1 MAG: ORF1 [TTV-like mini virus]UGV34638.1 MAG: ORF1 [TTV-like mini virus]